MTSGIEGTGEITHQPGTETAVLAGGCFWGLEDLIRRQPGVLDTRVGYTGGDHDHATYPNHAGHAEAVEIVFDPTETTYRDILAFFFQVHDPSTLNRQGNDVGSSYRSAVFPLTPEQVQVARDTIADLDEQGSGPARRSRLSSRPRRSGRRSRSIRTISSRIRTDTPATSCARTGCFRSGRNRQPDIVRAAAVPSLAQLDDGLASRSGRGLEGRDRIR